MIDEMRQTIEHEKDRRANLSRILKHAIRVIEDRAPDIFPDFDRRLREDELRDLGIVEDEGD